MLFRSYQDKDPILQLADHLKKEGLATAEDLETWDKQTREKVKAAEKVADDAPKSDMAHVWNHVFAD